MNKTIYGSHCEDKQVLKDGKLHSFNGEPAVVEYERVQFVESESEDGEDGYEGTKYWLSYVTLAEWYQNGKLHREDGPARTKYKPPVDSLETKCSLTLEEWYNNGKLHRENGPARTKYKPPDSYFEKSILTLEEWYQHGELHREDGPARTEYYIDGVISEQKWYIEGKLVRSYDHFDDKYFDEEDEEDDDENTYYNIFSKTKWYNENGELHREDGPAYTSILKTYSKVDGTIILDTYYEEWYRNGEIHRENVEISPEEKEL